MIALVLSRMDATVRLRGGYSKKANGKGHRVDYAPPYTQLRPLAAHVLLYNLASHAEVMALGVALVNYHCATSVWPAMEPDCTARSIDLALLDLGPDTSGGASAGDQTLKPARQYRGRSRQAETTLFPNEGKVVVSDYRREDNPHLCKNLTSTLLHADVAFVGGPCGVGKSTRVPQTLVKMIQDADRDVNVCGGIAHCIPTNTTAETLFQHYRWQGGAPAQMVCRWHGASNWTKIPPRTWQFVALCTPVSLFHRFQQANAWEDIRFVVLDEVRGQGKHVWKQWPRHRQSCP